MIQPDSRYRKRWASRCAPAAETRTIGAMSESYKMVQHWIGLMTTRTLLSEADELETRCEESAAYRDGSTGRILALVRAELKRRGK